MNTSNHKKTLRLVSQMEKGLRTASDRTETAKQALSTWITTGDARLRKRGSSAVRHIKKLAADLTAAVAALDTHLIDQIELAPKPAPHQRSLSEPSKIGNVDPVAQTRVRGKSKARRIAASGLNTRVRGHLLARGQRSQAKRDARNA